MNKIKNYSYSIFDSIKHIDEDGYEYWYARELQKIIDYKEWRKFLKIIDKAKMACELSDAKVDDHFVQVDKMIKIAKGAIRKTEDYKLSRHACYLIALAGDERKRVISQAKNYFAIQTRKQEILEELSEDDRRLSIRKKVKEGNIGLQKTALESGVKNMAEFHNAGYKGLYNGETADDIFKRKGLRYREDILDNMGSSELAANLFRITQTDDKLKLDKVDNEYKANSIHYDVGRRIRKTIEDIGGTMPEDLPNPNKSLKEIEKNNKNNN